MKRVSIFLLLILNLFVFSLGFVRAEAEETFAGATYEEVEVQEENFLPYGVYQRKVWANTSTSMEGYVAAGYNGGTTELVEPGKPYSQQVNIMEVPSSENVRITTWAHLNGHKWSLATVRALINDYEAKNPGWKVIGAINGDFFDINGNGNLPYQTSGALVSNGEFYKTTSGNMVGFRNDGSVNSLVGNKPVVKSEKMILSVYDEDGNIIKDLPIDKVNQLPGENESSVFYAIYNSEKKIVPVEVTENGYFVDQAELALPNNANDFYGRGVISSTEAKTISTGQFAIVTNNEEVNELLDLGVRIRVQYKFEGDYEGINDISGGGTTIIENGEDSGVSITDRAPRTVIGRKADGTIIMMVIDGRQATKGMYGADRTELGAIMSHYGAVEAYNLDGGGSSTMVIKKDGEFVVLNSPSDGSERTDANAILVVVKDPELDIKPEITTNSIDFEIDIVNKNGHDVEELYITLNNERKLVEDGKASFTNLKNNTSYDYFFEYKDKDGEFTRIITSGIIKTYKITPEYTKLTIYETGSRFEFYLEYIDPDKAGSLGEAELVVDGKGLGFFYDGVKNVPKTHLTEIKEKVVVKTFYNIGDGKRELITLEVTEIIIIRNTEAYLSNIINVQNEYIARIYK
ncbi:MAG TPA: hypothetical protein GX740_03485 [Acholeplasmataceae bacterium]|nr:hypothetical protein [Acholeplasmataceae bacterium]